MAKGSSRQGHGTGAGGTKRSGNGTTRSDEESRSGANSSAQRKQSADTASDPKPAPKAQAKKSEGRRSQASKAASKTSAPASQETAATAELRSEATTTYVETGNQSNRQDQEKMSNGTDDQTAQKIADYEQKKSEVNQQRRMLAERVVHQHAAVAAGVGVIPVPVIDIAGLAVVQLRMLAKLADQYDVKYSGNLGRTLVSALLGVLVPVSLKTTTYGLLRSVPVFGPLLGFLTLPGFSWAATYAIGTVFIDAFEQDEDLETMNVDRAKEKVKQVFEQAKAKANEAANTATAKTA